MLSPVLNCPFSHPMSTTIDTQRHVLNQLPDVMMTEVLSSNPFCKEETSLFRLWVESPRKWQSSSTQALGALPNSQQS